MFGGFAGGSGLEVVTRRLILLRHADSSLDDPALDDFDRPLSARGREAAAAIGAYLRRHAMVPGLVLCSAALRARETCDLVASALDGPLDTRIEKPLYMAAYPVLLARLRRLADDLSSVMLVGHNPGLASLALRLCGRGGSADLDRMHRRFPAGAFAVLSFEGDAWSALDGGVGTLDRFVIPKDLR